MAEGAAIVVPVKPLTRAKSRLAGLSDGTRRALVLAMLGDVLAAARAAHSGDLVLLSSDPAYDVAAARVGARRVPDRARGYREAVQSALQHDLPDAGAALLLPADLPQARDDEVTALLDAMRTADVVLVPSEDGGTSALGLRPPLAIEVAFGPGSAALHREAARAAGLAVREPALPRLRTDVDTLDNLRRIAGEAGPRTRALLDRPALQPAAGGVAR